MEIKKKTKFLDYGVSLPLTAPCAFCARLKLIWGESNRMIPISNFGLVNEPLAIETMTIALILSM
jgi:hypothetical protein